MKEKIGGVELNYYYYGGKDLYSDGNIEDMILEYCKEEKEDELLRISSEWAVLYHLAEERGNVIEWYDMKPEAEILEIGSGLGAITKTLSDKAKKVTCVELSKKRSLINAYRNKKRNNIEILVGNFEEIEGDLGLYDYITLIGVLEYAASYIHEKEPYKELLVRAQKHLKPDGKLIIAIENKMGLKYWNGAEEDHTGVRFDGINDYLGSNNIRTFSRKELSSLLENSGFGSYCFYYPFPDYKLPTSVYSDEYQPKVGDLRENAFNYSSVWISNFDQDTVWDQVCLDGMFTYFSNSFLVITSEKSTTNLFVKYNPSRKSKYNVITSIKEENAIRYVKKTACSKAANAHLSQLPQKQKEWSKNQHSFICNAGEFKDGSYQERYLDGLRLDEKILMKTHSPKDIIDVLKQIVSNYFTPKEYELTDFVMSEDFIDIFGQVNFEDEKSLRVTNIDLTLSNLICKDDKIYAIDCEWIFDFAIPYKYVIWRMIRYFYFQYYNRMKEYMSIGNYLNEFGLTREEQIKFYKMEIALDSYTTRKKEYSEVRALYSKKTYLQITR